jgi:uncharacterized membrane protein YjgN (DUF898 family)
MDKDLTGSIRPTLSFTGKGSEYFGIWIVNLLLTILTLGIYSAWAKVRSLRYFYSNTLLDNAPFNYTATPQAILRGRLFAFAIFAFYGAVVHFYPLAELPLLLVFLIAVPWLVVRSLMFSRYHSTYRNLRFGFQPNYGGAVSVFLGLTLLIPFTLGLITPYIAYRKARFVIENSTYGQSHFTFAARVGDYYRAYLQAFGIFIGSALLILGSVAAVIYSSPGLQEAFISVLAELQKTQAPEDPSSQFGVLVLLGVLAYAILLMLGYATYFFLAAVTTNLSWNGTHLDGVRFESSLNPYVMLWLGMSNAFLILISLGLLYPWARIRIARYHVERLTVVASGNLDRFAARRQSATSAAGEELADVFDVGVAL